MVGVWEICLTKKRGNCKATTFQLPDIIRQNERQISKMHYAVAQLVLVVALVVSVVIISIPLHCLASSHSRRYILKVIKNVTGCKDTRTAKSKETR